MKKGILSLLMLVLVFSAVLAGCGGNKENASGTTTPADEGQQATAEPTKEPEQAKPFTITLRHTQVDDSKKFRLKILQDAVAAAEKDVPGLKIELDGVQDDANRFTKLPAEMAAGNPPQIFDLFSGAADAQKYAKAGRLLDLTPILDELGIKDKFLDLSGFMVDGKVYGLPIGGSSEGFFYSKPLFEKYSLQEPKTWDDLENILSTLKSNGVTPLAAGSSAAWVPVELMNTLYARFAGPDFAPGLVDGSKKWTDPGMLAAAQKFEEWEKKGYFVKGELGFDYTAFHNQLIAGKAGLMFDGSWSSSIFKDPEQAGDLTGKVGYFAMPPAPNGIGDQNTVNGNFSNGYGFSAKLDENELKAVKAFIKEMYNDQMQTRGLLEDNVLPSMKVEGLDSQITDPIIKQVITTMNNANSAFPVYDAIVQKEPYTATEQNLQKLIGAQIDAKTMLENIQKVQDSANAQQ